MLSIHENLPAVVHGKGDQFKDLILYFASNAFKRSANIRVGVNLAYIREGYSVIEIQVQDNGPGMSEKELDVCYSSYRAI